MNLEILIIDDRIEDAQAAASILSELANVGTVPSSDHEKCLQLIQRNPNRFALVLIDFNLNLKNLDGLGLAKKIWSINPDQLVAIFSGESSLEVPIKCVGTPIVEFIRKGSPATLIQKRVQNLLRKYTATHRPVEVSKVLLENESICASLGLIGKSAGMADLARMATKVAASETATVLIRGGSGTGKELVARGVHNLSRRKDAPFVPINMGAFQSNLIESELFGHEKGAFTGASQSRQGAFELANGGTIFLDEIGELPLDLQVKLLRVLQEREVQPVGANRPIKIDVRVIAATHVDLEAQIAAGKFRFDLFQRLNVIALNIPKLRKRTDDIQGLAVHFLKKYKSSKSLHHTTLLQLEKYAWPGNVRELENLIQRLDIMTDDQVIMPQHLPSEVFAAVSEPRPSGVDFTMDYKSMTKFVQDLEKEYYLYHLAKAKSVRDAALNRMDMPPSTLRDKMEIYGIVFRGLEGVEQLKTEEEANEECIT